jgi:FMN reductase
VLIVGIGGTTRAGSTSEIAVRTSLRAAEQQGATTLFFGAQRLQLPFYDLRCADRTEDARALVSAVREADGLLISSPGYHGAVSGLLKNALDYVEDLAADESPYLHGKPVGCISVAYGWQAAASTLANLRAIVHALRGWPTPYGAAINAARRVFDDGACVEQRAEGSLRLVGAQVVEFAQMTRAHAAASAHNLSH